MQIDINKIIIGNEQESCAIVRDIEDVEIRDKTLIIKLNNSNIGQLFLSDEKGLIEDE